MTNLKALNDKSLKVRDASKSNDECRMMNDEKEK
jgi:hypothetical protein